MNGHAQLPNRSDVTMCCSVDCAAPATKLVALVDMDGEAFPYCHDCADVLLRGGEKLAGVVDPVTDEMVRRARLAQGIQRIGPVGEHDGKPRDEDTLLFYADSEDEMRAVLVAAFSTQQATEGDSDART